MEFQIDHGSSAAISYQRYFEHLLEKYRNMNDGLNLTEAETQQIRGRIALLKELIALPKTKEILDAQSRHGQPE